MSNTGGQEPSRFSGEFELIPLFEDGRPLLKNGHCEYAVARELAFRTDDGQAVTVFASYRTDLASIPRALWPLLPPDGPWALAAVFHDAGYSTLGSYAYRGRLGRSLWRPYSRAEVDGILLQAMTALGVPGWKRFLIWSAVRLFGGAGWGS